jgi:ketosteroid isomerase-like protein
VRPHYDERGRHSYTTRRDLTLERVEETDDVVIASLCLEGEGTSSGVRVQMHVHLVGTFREGRLVRRQVFRTLDEALEAVGLWE